jgi:predicted transcriptional regulator
MNVLLSIRPKYVEKIINGEKKYEFRKSPFRREVDEIWIYATSPIKRIIGSFVIGKTIEDVPESLWRNLDGSSGMTEEDFFRFFKDKDIGFAFEIKSLKLFDAPINPFEVLPDFRPPHSFCYLKRNIIDNEL